MGLMEQTEEAEAAEAAAAERQARAAAEAAERAALEREVTAPRRREFMLATLLRRRG
jgi:hypothetical protein|eukprot:SAG25_NODE_9509_length_369_cov_1.325926_1_plen_57_part_00